MRTSRLIFFSVVVLTASWCVLSLPACESEAPAGSALSAADVTRSDGASGGAVADTTPAVKDTTATTPDPGGPASDPGAGAPDPGAAAPDPGATAPDSGETAPDPGETATDAGTPELCGNGECDEGEDPCTCPADCLSMDTCCEALDCPQPKCGPCCKAECKDFKCAEPIWLEPCCWNNKCEEGETYESCPQDCPNPCGDEVCAADEDPCSCPDDCPVGAGSAGDACCSADDCSQPRCGPCCKVHCTDYQCTEPIWLEPCCWNNKCEEGETHETCPLDCPAPSEDCDDYYACDGNDDCVKANAGCCSCSMGGQSVAVAASCVDELRADLNCPPELNCIAMYNCDDSVAVCKEGRCVLEGGRSEPIE